MDNEIFALEREISDCNSRYNMLMANRNSNTLNSNNASNTLSGGDVGAQIHQIMEQLEEKTELLFRLRKERQSIIEAECRMLPSSANQYP